MLEGRLLWKIVGLVVIYDGKFRAVTECAIKRTRIGLERVGVCGTVDCMGLVVRSGFGGVVLCH